MEVVVSTFLLEEVLGHDHILRHSWVFDHILVVDYSLVVGHTQVVASVEHHRRVAVPDPNHDQRDLDQDLNFRLSTVHQSELRLPCGVMP